MIEVCVGRWWSVDALLLEFDGAMSKLPYPVLSEATKMLDKTLSQFTEAIASQDWTVVSLAVDRLQEYCHYCS
jgi:hypothetical protein